MASDIKAKYPATTADSAAVTITLASLASSSSLLAGQEGTSIVNTADLDLDKQVTGLITVGTTPTTATRIEIWAGVPIKIVSGAPTWPDTLTGANAAVTITSSGIKYNSLSLVAAIEVDSATSNRGYPFRGKSLAEIFDRNVPAMATFFVTHNTGVTLHATAGNHFIHLHRIQQQLV